ncbi:MAG: cysteine dioxygenase family protein [Bacteroidota bacterium]
MQTSSKVQAMIEALEACSGPEFVDIVDQLKISAQDLEDFVSWNEKSYARHCIHATGDYELLVLCWEPGQSTEIHTHGGQECWVMAIDGSLDEIRYSTCVGKEPQEVARLPITGNRISYMKDEIGMHVLSNPHSVRAITLHLYMNPIRTCEIYDPNTNSTRTKLMSYDTK